jgi:hypothetical protein
MGEEGRMGGEITVGGVPDVAGAAVGPRLVPLQVGGATVYIIPAGHLEVVADATIYPVAPPAPQDVLGAASDAIEGCVRAVGERIERLAGAVRPDEVTLEFELSFEVKGKASLVPVLVTGETGARTGLKITAVWKGAERPAGRGPAEPVSHADHG